MQHGSLFSGIGGFDLAAWWLGWENIFNVEIDPFCRQVLKTHFPLAAQFDDIKKFNGRRYYGAIDIISGGFPCQPFSLAGQRRGREDDRYLWPEMLRVIGEVRPTWVVGENVAEILSLVQPGVPIDLAMQTYFGKENQEIITEHEFIVETICKDFERIGYSIQPFLIPACGAGAPHRRNRVWFIAYSESHDGGRQLGTMGEKSEAAQKSIQSGTNSTTRSIDAKWTTCHPNSTGLEGTTGKILSPGGNEQPTWTDPIPAWADWASQSAVCGRNDGFSHSLVNISFSKWRKKASGHSAMP